MKVVQIVPRGKVHLYGAIVKKEAAIRKNDRGTFYRAGRKKQNEAKWNHKRYKGAVNLKRGDDEIVTARVRSPNEEWQMLSAFLGWVNRHFGDRVTAVNITYS
jgi:hypothetical protein